MFRRNRAEFENKIEEYRRKLQSYGVVEVDLPKFPLEYWSGLVGAFMDMYAKFPILQDSIKKIQYRYVLENAAGMVNFPNKKELNYECIENQTLHLNFLLKYKQLSSFLSWSSVKCGIHIVWNMKAVVVHELAHELELVLTQKLYGIKFDDDSVKQERFEALAGHLGAHSLLRLILQDAFGIESVEGNLPVVRNCKYAFDSDSEFMAEMLAIYFCAPKRIEYCEKFYDSLKHTIKLYNLVD